MLRIKVIIVMAVFGTKRASDRYSAEARGIERGLSYENARDGMHNSHLFGDAGCAWCCDVGWVCRHRSRYPVPAGCGPAERGHLDPEVVPSAAERVPTRPAAQMNTAALNFVEVLHNCAAGFRTLDAPSAHA